jgi:uncharacterized protein
LLCALDLAFGPALEVVIAGNPDKEDTKKMLEALRKEFLPNTTVVLTASNGDGSQSVLGRLTIGKTSIDGKATAYVCTNRSCKQPVVDVDLMLTMLSSRL